MLLLGERNSWCMGQGRASGCVSISHLIDAHQQLTGGTQIAWDRTKSEAKEMLLVPPSQTLKSKDRIVHTFQHPPMSPQLRVSHLMNQVSNLVLI